MHCKLKSFQRSINISLTKSLYSVTVFSDLFDVLTLILISHLQVLMFRLQND